MDHKSLEWLNSIADPTSRLVEMEIEISRVHFECVFQVRFVRNDGKGGEGGHPRSFVIYELPSRAVSSREMHRFLFI